MPRPKREMRITGRRPTRSDRAPRRGAKRNCIRAYVDARMPNQRPAAGVLPPANSLISSGRMGMINPDPQHIDEDRDEHGRSPQPGAAPGAGSSRASPVHGMLGNRPATIGGPMTFGEFEQLAHRLLERIPRRFREGVDGLTVHRRAAAHPRFHDVYTLGECATESFPASYGGPDSIRSIVHLYWGSFRALSELDGDFDWREQAWETLTHELRHHLESLADRDDLGRVDYAVEQEFRRSRGEALRPPLLSLRRPSGARRVRGRGPGVHRAAMEAERLLQRHGDSVPMGGTGVGGGNDRRRSAMSTSSASWTEWKILRTLTWCWFARLAWLAAVRRRLAGRVPVVLESDAVALLRRG